MRRKTLGVKISSSVVETEGFNQRFQRKGWQPMDWFFVVYLVVSALAAFFHEPWRDEAQKWLIARDCHSIGEFFRLMPYEGSPCLWALLQVPFAKLGCPYRITQVLNWAFTVGAAALVWFRSGLPAGIRLPFLFGYFAVYDFAAIARNYGLGFFLLFVAITLLSSKRPRAPALAVSLVLLMNTNVFGLIAGVVIGAAHCLERIRNVPHWPSIAGFAATVGLGAILCVLQLLPPDDTGSVNEVIGTRQIIGGTPLLSHFYPWLFTFGENFGALLFLIVMIAIITFGVSLYSHFGAFALFVASVPLPIRLFSSGYYSSQYAAVILYAGLAAEWWLRTRSLMRDHNTSQPRFSGDSAVSAKLRVWLLGTALWFSVVFGVTNIVADTRALYSGAESVARFIRDNQLERLPMAAFRDAWGSAVAPFLPGTQFFYPGSQRYGTFIVQDGVHKRNDFLGWNEGLSRAFSEFRGEPRFLLVSSAEIYVEKVPQYFRLLFKVSKPEVIEDEEYFLYECYPRGGK